MSVGVLYGGRSPERRGSLASGEAAAKALAESGHSAELIDVAQMDPVALPGRIDIAFIALHGPGGEDGAIQGMLETIGLPYTGSGVLASAVGMHKPAFKTLVAGNGLDTPRWVVLDRDLQAEELASTVGDVLGYPVFFKPCSGGGSLGAAIACDEGRLAALITASRDQPYCSYMVEELICGRPCTVGLLDIDGELTPLPVLDIETGREFYDYTAKHDPAQRMENCPSTLSGRVTERLRELALRAHRLIGAHGVSRVDFMVTPTGRLAMLEINTAPGLSTRGNLATMARAAGISHTDLIRHILATAHTTPITSTMVPGR